jgi:uncharacterized membrane protein YoaK (UPF0700 family)
MDALSYLALDGIFVSFMSGSTIFLGLRIGAGNGPSALNASAAIIGYVGGVALAAYIAYPGLTQEKMWPRSATKMVAIELVLLVVFAISGSFAGKPPAQFAVYFLIALASLAMGIQSAIVYALGVYGVVTTAISATWTGAIIGLVDWRRSPATKRAVKEKQNLGVQGVVLLLFLLGATAGGLAETRFFLEAAIVPIVIIGLVIVIASLRMR